jgi:hypothetical protein
MGAKTTLLRARCRVGPGTGAALAGLLAIGGGGAQAQAPLGPAKTDSPVSLEQGAGFVLLDLTKQEDKTSPVIRLGYQAFVGDGVRRMRADNPQTDIHNVPYYSVNIAGTPSGDVANIFGGGEVSTGADVQLSFGQAYVLSFATPRDVSVASANVRQIKALADEIEEAKNKRPSDQAAITQARTDLTAIRGSLVGKQEASRLTAYRLLFQAVIDYADAVAAYTAPDMAVKPSPPDPKAIMGQRRGPIYDAWFVRLGLNAGSTTLFDAARPFGEQFEEKDYNGYSAQLGYSVRFGGSLPYIVALSGGVKRSSNVDDLGSVEVTETQSFTSPDGVTRRGTNRKRTGLVGEFEQETNALGKFDLVLYPGLAAASRDGENPKSTLAIDIFGRAERGSRTSYGVGAYITRPGSPTSVYGGVNAYRAADGKLAIDLVAGFPF